MKESDMGYGGINFPIDYCNTCGYLGIIPKDNCPACGGQDIQQIRRITGYLSTVERFNDAKISELNDRVKHV